VFFGQAASSFGSALVPVALAFAVLRLTGSVTDLGFVVTAEFVAQLVMFLAGGVIADRISRRTVMIAADVTRAASQGLLGILLLTTRPHVAVIVVLAAVQGLAGGVFTPASQGMTPSLVPVEDLQAANLLQSMSGSIAWIIGPAVGGVLVATVGGGWALLGDAVTYVINIGMLSRITLELPAREPTQSFLRELGVGWREFRALDWYFYTVLTVAILNVFVSSYFVLGPEIARRHYGGAVAWGVIGASGSVGSLIGGFWAMRLRLRYPLRVGLLLCAGFGLVPVALALQLPLPVVCVISAFGFFGPLLFNSLIYATVQRVVPEHLLSRLFSYEYFLGFLFLPIGTLLAGPIAGHIGLRETLLISGVVQLIGAPAILFIRSVRDLEDPAATEPAADPLPA
jgi:MFS family permease